MKEIKITTEYIKLDQFLKLSGCVSNGGEAKILIGEGLALVNGEKELRRGKKLRTGDIVIFKEKEYMVV
ncbi:MAG: RNA-binding S4 domain-containing protein [Clostridia bacterium]|nr:RNA-binding S4 domain-containing protein [Clostridia bacterium]MBN2883637.1 RNA-binding S4 domain-containing protein [Clostridia bacterium]